MTMDHAERRFVDRLEWEMLGPTLAVIAAALGGVLLGYEWLAMAGSQPLWQAEPKTLSVLLVGVPGALSALAFLLGLGSAGLFGAIGIIFAVVGGLAVITGTAAGILLVILGGVFVLFGSLIPWGRLLPG
jgi:hypothetical protein